MNLDRHQGIPGGPTCSVLRLSGSPQAFGLQQADFLLSNPSFSNAESLRRWKQHGAPGASSRFVASLRDAMERWAPRLLREIEALASGINVESDAVLAGWLPKIATETRAGCSLIGVRTPKGPLVGRNFDIGYSRIDIRVMLTSPSEGFSSFGTGGFVGRYDGMNETGLAIAMAVVEAGDGSEREIPPSGSLPATILIRKILDEKRSVPEALDLLKQVPCWSPINYIMADASGAVVVVERDHGQFRCFEAGMKPLGRTNHFPGRDGSHGSPERYSRIEQCEPASLNEVDDMKRFIHSLGDSRLTKWHEVFSPKTQEVHFSGGFRATYLTFCISGHGFARS